MIASPLSRSLPPVTFLLSFVSFLLSSLLPFFHGLTFCHLRVLTNLKMHKQDSSFVTSIPSVILFSPELLPMSSSRLSLFHFSLVNTSFHLLFSFPPFLFLSPPHALYSFQYSVESIVSGLMVCPLKRSGGITPVIPL